MTNLTHAAQAVLDAFLKTPGEEPMPGWDYGRDLAAALRAAAEHLNTTSPWPGHIESTGVNWSRNELLAIAAELEGVTYGTYRCNLEAQ